MTTVEPWRNVLLALAATTAVFALAGAISLATGVLELGTVAENRLPLHSAAIAGLALFAIVAMPMAVTTWFAARRDVRADAAAAVAGGALIGWIVVQILFLRVFSWLQPTMAIVGAAVLTIGYLHWKRAR